MPRPTCGILCPELSVMVVKAVADDVLLSSVMVVGGCERQVVCCVWCVLSVVWCSGRWRVASGFCMIGLRHTQILAHAHV